MMTGSVIEAHPGFSSEILGNERTIHVYLPPDYAGGRARYPVLYMQDGQNLFDPAQAAFGVEWEAGKTADRLIAEGSMEPIIIEDPNSVEVQGKVVLVIRQMGASPI